MAFDEILGQRVLAIIQAECPEQAITEKRMFGGLGIMINGNMACGVVGYNLMVRVGTDAHDECVALPHAGPMDFTGKPMKGFLYVYPEGFDSAQDLKKWVRRGIAFAQSLPKK
ncbi:MAG: TfoX/Sxy family protein [Acidobacteriota bacterium]